MERDWMFAADGYICDVRTVGVLIRDGKILVQRERDGNEYALPGGHIRVGETLEKGLIREFKEETGADIVCTEMLWSEECFWEWAGRKVHNIAFYYRVELCPGSELPEAGGFISHKDNCNVVIGWMPVEEIAGAVIYPEFLKEEIHCLHGPRKHFVTQG